MAPAEAYCDGWQLGVNEAIAMTPAKRGETEHTMAMDINMALLLDWLLLLVTATETAPAEGYCDG